LTKSLEHDQQVVLDPPRIYSVGFEKAPERFDAVMGTNKVDDTKFFHRLAHEIFSADPAEKSFTD